MRISVFERNTPLVKIRIKDKLPDGTTQAYPLSTATDIEFYAKERKSDSDANAEFIYKLSSGEIAILDTGADPTDDYSLISIQFQAADTLVARNLWHHLDVIKGTTRETVNADILEIVNI